MIFNPWIAKFEAVGGRFNAGHAVRDVRTNDAGHITTVLTETREGGRRVGGHICCALGHRAAVSIFLGLDMLSRSRTL